jgi:hypothetical protein
VTLYVCCLSSSVFPMQCRAQHSTTGGWSLQIWTNLRVPSHYTEYSIYYGFINIMGLYIRLSYFHPFQQFFIQIDNFYPFFIHCSSNLPTLYNVKEIVWPTVYAVFSVTFGKISPKEKIVLSSMHLSSTIFNNLSTKVFVPN